MKTLLFPGLVLLALLLGAADGKPPTPVEPGKAERNFTIIGSSLTIQPGPESTYLRFSGGIVCTANDMHLSADVLELDVSSGSLQTQGSFKFPSVPKPLVRVVDDPGEMAQSMASELELPKATFSGNAITRVGAKGNVSVDFMGMSLHTSELVSPDGGNSWAASGRTSISSNGLDNGSSFTLAADNLIFDMAHHSALAKGNIEGHFSGDKLEQVEIRAERLELNETTQMMVVSGEVVVTYGTVTLACGFLPENGPAETGNGTTGLIEFDLDSRLVIASGGVVLEDSSQGLRLSAEKITASIDEKWAEATGNPLVVRGDSSFSGERILVTDLGGKVVVEVSGPQDAVLVPGETSTETPAS